MSNLSLIPHPSSLISQIESHPKILSNYWLLGLAWLLQGEEAEAQAAWFSAAMAIDPETVEAGMPELLQLLRTEAARQSGIGQFQTAERIYQQLLELEMTAADALALGSVVSQQGRYDEAIAYWQSAIDWQSGGEPTDHDLAAQRAAYAKQAEVWQKLGQLEEAIAAYRQAIAIQADWQTGDWQTGDWQTGDWQTGDWQTGDWQTQYQLGLCLAERGDWNEAIAAYHQAIQQSDRQEIHGDLGWALLQIGEREAAIAQLQQANFAGDTTQLPMLQTGQASHWQTAEADEALSPSGLPMGWYEMAQAWAQAEATKNYIPLDAAELVELHPPKTLDAEIHFSFRFGAAIELPGSFVAIVPNGQFWLSADQTSSALFTAGQHLIGDLSPEFPLLSPGHPEQHPSRHSVLGKPIEDSVRSPIQAIEGTVLLLAGLTNDLYFHWMLDVLPRWNLVQRSGIELSQIDRIVVSDRLPFQRETLDRLGIPASKILPIEQHRQGQAQQLIVPSYPAAPAWMPRWAGDWLRQTFLSDKNSEATSGNPATRLYISRSQTTGRRIRNEAAVIELLQPYGFQCVTLESLSVQAQAELLASAEMVVAAHGGGLTNLVFCRPDTKVIELFSPRYVYPCYWWISNLMKLQYAYLLGKMPSGLYLDRLQYPDERLADIWIDLVELRSLLDSWI
jgi:tetratricopeptide (TPR) repeat protein